MAKKDYSPDIHSLEISLPYYSINQQQLSTGDLKILSKAYIIYAGYCESLLGYDVDQRINDVYSFQKHVKVSEISSLISKLTELNKSEEKEKPTEQTASIPPELESLVVEYEQNKALLDSEEIKSNSQKSVAEQVKIAVAYKNRNDLILANKQRRQENGEKFRNPDEALVSLGSPKSISKSAALSSSYKAVQEVAFNNESFNKLTPATQNLIIDEAVNLNLRCVTNIDVAIQSAALLINDSNIPTEDQQELKNVSSNYIHSVYDAINTQTQQAATYQSQIDENEIALLQLEREAKKLSVKELEVKIIQIKSLTENNKRLEDKINNLPGQFEVFNKNQITDFQKFERESLLRISKDPDIKDWEDLANSNVGSIQGNLKNNGVTPKFVSSLDDAHLLEQALRNNIPGSLNSHAGYNAEYAAALINNPKTQDENLSPQAILLTGMGLTPNLLAHAREFAIKNPNSSLGKLYKTRKDIFDSVGAQIRKISNSQLGKDITSANKGIGKIFNSSSKFFGKLSDKIPGGFGGALRIIQDPLGSLRSFVGKKAGQFFLRQISQRVSSEALKKTAEYLIGGGIKKAVSGLTSKVVAKAATWVALKLGFSAALESLNAVIPGAGLLLDLAVQVVLWIGEKTLGMIKKTIDNISESLYGEKIKARDLLAIPAAGAAATIGGISAVVVTLSAATYVAAKSALSSIVLGTFIGIFFYITSIVMAPLISTLVQLETQPSTMNCNGATLTNDKKHCKTSGGKEYCFPVNDLSSVNYSDDNHDYPAADIFRNGDVPGQQDDIPLPILAFVSGTVSWISENDGLGGYSFIINGDDGLFYYYAHNMCNLVTLGQTVNAGDVIAGMDSTGNAIDTPEHVHFQISDQENMVTIPENYPHFLPPWEAFCKKLGLCGSHAGY